MLSARRSPYCGAVRGFRPRSVMEQHILLLADNCAFGPSGSGWSPPPVSAHQQARSLRDKAPVARTEPDRGFFLAVCSRYILRSPTKTDSTPQEAWRLGAIVCWR
jgi:hypothetical protein